VTIDAIGTQTEITKTIVDGGGYYPLVVKENQGHLFNDIQCLFNVDIAHGMKYAQYNHAKIINKGHGRIETRECWVTDREDHLSLLRNRQQCKGLKSVFRIVSERKTGEVTEVQTRYFIPSLLADAKTILKAKRSHWKIENQVHWILDIAFREDESRVRQDHAVENLAVLRHVALNLLKMRRQLKVAFEPSVYKLVGIMITCSLSSEVELRLPWDRPDTSPVPYVVQYLTRDGCRTLLSCEKC
jgi:predicted transposase YbfD/YdcC